jgi:hypothetical protein
MRPEYQVLIKEPDGTSSIQIFVLMTTQPKNFSYEHFWEICPSDPLTLEDDRDPKVVWVPFRRRNEIEVWHLSDT